MQRVVLSSVVCAPNGVQDLRLLFFARYNVVFVIFSIGEFGFNTPGGDLL